MKNKISWFAFLALFSMQGSLVLHAEPIVSCMDTNEKMESCMLSCPQYAPSGDKNVINNTCGACASNCQSNPHNYTSEEMDAGYQLFNGWIASPSPDNPDRQECLYAYGTNEYTTEFVYKFGNIPDGGYSTIDVTSQNRDPDNKGGISSTKDTPVGEHPTTDGASQKGDTLNNKDTVNTQGSVEKTPNKENAINKGETAEKPL